MKELIKPNEEEENYEVNPYEEGSCCAPNVWRGNCNKYCTDGASNSSVNEDGDILF